MKLTDQDKLDVAKYVVELLTTALTEHGAYDMKLDNWMINARNECIMREGHYHKSYNRIGR